MNPKIPSISVAVVVLAGLVGLMLVFSAEDGPTKSRRNGLAGPDAPPVDSTGASSPETDGPVQGTGDDPTRDPETEPTKKPRSGGSDVGEGSEEAFGGTDSESPTGGGLVGEEPSFVAPIGAPDGSGLQADPGDFAIGECREAAADRGDRGSLCGNIDAFVASAIPGSVPVLPGPDSTHTALGPAYHEVRAAA